MIDTRFPLAQRRKKEGYAAVSALGIESDPGVFCLAATEDTTKLRYRLREGQEKVFGKPCAMHFVRLIWTPGLPVARTLVSAAEKFLTDIGCSLGRSWFRAEIDIFDDLIRHEVFKMGCQTWTNAELIVKLRTLENSEADRYAEGRV